MYELFEWEEEKKRTKQKKHNSSLEGKPTNRPISLLFDPLCMVCVCVRVCTHMGPCVLLAQDYGDEENYQQ